MQTVREQFLAFCDAGQVEGGEESLDDRDRELLTVLASLDACYRENMDEALPIILRAVALRIEQLRAGLDPRPEETAQAVLREMTGEPSEN